MELTDSIDEIHRKPHYTQNDRLTGSEEPKIELEKEITDHPSFNQVMLDVNRCAGRLGDGESSQEEQKKLARLIVNILMVKPELCYYQGFHDVCLTCLDLYGEQEAFDKMISLVETHLYRFMQPSIKETEEMLRLIPILILLENSTLYEFLERSKVGTIFSLSWVITWFSHVINDKQQVNDLFEFFASNNPYLVLYFSAAIVLHKADIILKLDCDMSTVHCYLSRVARKTKLPIDLLKDRSLELFNIYPPKQLETLRHREDLKKQIRTVVSNVPVKKTAMIVFILVSAIIYQYIRR